MTLRSGKKFHCATANPNKGGGGRGNNPRGGNNKIGGGNRANKSDNKSSKTIMMRDKDGKLIPKKLNDMEVLDDEDQGQAPIYEYDLGRMITVSRFTGKGSLQNWESIAQRCPVSWTWESRNKCLQRCISSGS